MHTAWEQFHHATLELVGSAPIKQRLICAYRRHLSKLRAEQLPGDVREPFGQILRSLSGVQPLRGEDQVVASVRKMSGHEADECAALIVEIFCSMCRAPATPARAANPPVKLHRVAEGKDAGEMESPAWIANS